MKKQRVAAQSRSYLAARYATIGPPVRFKPPVRGWIHALRGALGMTTAQLALRMGVKQPTIIALERSEAKGTIELATLKRAAEALDCTLIYALVPNKPIETTVRERAKAFARRMLQPVEHSMLLENQTVTDWSSSEDPEAKEAKLDAQLDDLMRETNPRLFWD